VIPKRHIPRLSDLTDRDAALVGELVLVARRIAKEKGVGGSGYRVVMNCNRDAGQEVLHLHLHLLGGRAMGWPPG
jgi:histidine triad (HIT) family protein